MSQSNPRPAELRRDCSIIRDHIESLEDQIETLNTFCPLVPPGRERAQCFARRDRVRENLRDAQDDLTHCESGLPNVGIQQTRGRVSFLSIHDVGTGFGPSHDSLDAEVIFKLSTESGRAFGFQLRDDDNRAARKSMYSLLEEALMNQLVVTIDYRQEENKHNAIAFRVAAVPNSGLPPISV